MSMWYSYYNQRRMKERKEEMKARRKKAIMEARAVQKRIEAVLLGMKNNEFRETREHILSTILDKDFFKELYRFGEEMKKRRESEKEPPKKLVELLKKISAEEHHENNGCKFKQTFYELSEEKQETIVKQLAVTGSDLSFLQPLQAYKYSSKVFEAYLNSLTVEGKKEVFQTILEDDKRNEEVDVWLSNHPRYASMIKVEGDEMLKKFGGGKKS